MRRKLQRFQALKTFSNVLEADKPLFKEVKGFWKAKVFANNNPIILEIGCGKGEYTLELAKQFPNQNFVGIDIKGDRLYIGAKQALACGLSNVCFLRIQAEQIVNFFALGEVREIWLTFPDPQPKKVRKRLTSLPFLLRYSQLLEIPNKIHLKTDSQELFDFTLSLLQKLEENYQCLDQLETTKTSADLQKPEILLAVKDLRYTTDLDNSDLGSSAYSYIQTTYEKKFRSQNKTIKYLEFQLLNYSSIK